MHHALVWLLHGHWSEFPFQLEVSVVQEGISG